MDKQGLKKAVDRVSKRCMVVWRNWGKRGYPRDDKRGVAAHNCLNTATFARGYAYEGKLEKATQKLTQAKDELRVAEGHRR
jgi:hypothetical protein